MRSPTPTPSARSADSFLRFGRSTSLPLWTFALAAFFRRAKSCWYQTTFQARASLPDCYLRGVIYGPECQTPMIDCRHKHNNERLQMFSHHLDKASYGCVCGSAWNIAEQGCSFLYPFTAVSEPLQDWDEGYSDSDYFECRKGHAHCGRH